MKLRCGWCDFETRLPGEMCAHITNTGHVCDPDLLDEVRMGGEAYLALSEGLTALASMPSDVCLDAMAKVEEDDEQYLSSRSVYGRLKMWLHWK